MDNAYALDMEAFSRGDIVDNRLKMIKEVERVMCNTDLAVLYLFSVGLILDVFPVELFLSFVTGFVLVFMVNFHLVVYL